MRHSHYFYQVYQNYLNILLRTMARYGGINVSTSTQTSQMSFLNHQINLGSNSIFQARTRISKLIDYLYSQIILTKKFDTDRISVNLFPLHGFTIGRSTLEELSQVPNAIISTTDPKYVLINGTNFWCSRLTNRFNRMYLVCDYCDLPKYVIQRFPFFSWTPLHLTKFGRFLFQALCQN